MSSTAKGPEVVGAFFKALGGGDMAGAFSLLKSDVRWTYHGPSTVIPFAGTFKGHAGVQRFFEAFGTVAEPIEMAPASMVEAEGLVYVRGIERSRIKATGKEYSVEWVHVIKVEGGLIQSFDEYLDSAAVAAAMG